MKTLLLVGILLCVGACSGSEFNASVRSFGEATERASSLQSDRLGDLNDRERSQIRMNLAETRVELRVTGECSALVIPGSGASPGDCKIVQLGGSEIPSPQRFSSIEALGKAVGDYGAALAALAGSASEDAGAFQASLLDLAGTVDGLDAALNTQAAPRATAASQEAQATILGAVAGAATEYQRARVLREIIVGVDPILQDAVQSLTQASDLLYTSEMNLLDRAVSQAQTELSVAIGRGANTNQIARLQSALFRAVEELKAGAATRNSFADIGKAHGALAKAAADGVNRDDMDDAIKATIDLIKTVETASKDL